MHKIVKRYAPSALAMLVLAISVHFGMLGGIGAAAAGGLFMIGNISFSTITQNLLVPLWSIEMDSSQAGYFLQSKRALLIGQMVSGGTAVAGTPYLVSRTDDAKVLFGTGSMLARMHLLHRLQDAIGEVWCIPLADDAAAVAASGTVTVTGTATQAGTIPLYIAGQKVNVPVALNDAAATVAGSIVTAVNAATNLPVTAAAVGAVVTLTCRWKGATGNDISVSDCFLGYAGGESLPTGITLAYVAMANGATNPSLTAAITAMGDIEYDYIIHPYTDTTSLNALQTEMNDSTGRWSYIRQIYGHCYTALRGTLNALVTAGQARNDQHHTLAGFETDVPNPNWEYAAAYGARNAVFLNADVSRPTQTGELYGILAPRSGKRFLITERQSLLSSGIATSYTGAGGIVRVDRAVTTYQKNAFNQTDPSYLDSEVMHQNAEFNRRMRSIITTKYPRHCLANDGTRFGPGKAILTPNMARGEFIAEYQRMMDDGLCENLDMFKKYLIVERDANNPNRLNALLPPDLVNQLRVVAAKNQFRLQYPAGA